MIQVKSTRFDLLLLSSLIVLSRVLSLLFNASFFFSTMLFFGLPALYLSLKNKDRKAIKKGFIFASLAIIPLTAIDIIGVINESWFVPASIFPFRLFGIVPLEDILWGFLLVYSTILFYEYFLDKGKNLFFVIKTAWTVILFFITLLFLSVVFLYLNPQVLNIQHFYLYSGVIFILIPTLAFLIFYPKLIPKFLKTGAYFFFLGVIFELTGLRLNQWQFPSSEFIGWVSIARHRFPVEELVFWLILFSSAMLSYYEFLFDDKK